MTPALASESLATRMLAPVGIVTRTAAPVPLPQAAAANESASVDRRIQPNRDRVISSLASRGSQRAPALSCEREARSREPLSVQAHGSRLTAHRSKPGPTVAIAMLVRAKLQFLAFPTHTLA